MSNVDSCFDCGWDYHTGYMLRVVNTRDDTLFISPCYNCCLKYITQGALQIPGYRIEVMKYGK